MSARRLMPIVPLWLLATLGCSLVTGKMNPKAAVTTSIRDAHPIADWLAYSLRNSQPVAVRTLALRPGYFRFNAQSYCLKAGKWGPTQGGGYLMAPLKGPRAKLIRNILRRSVRYPGILQKHIQRLLWGIEFDANFSKYSLTFQASVRPLLTAAEILFLTFLF